MIRNSVDLPQPDGPISDTNSPRLMSRSIPSRAVIVRPVATGEDSAHVGQSDDGSRGRRAACRSHGVRHHVALGAVRPRSMTRSASQIQPKNTTPRSEAARIAAHSFSGPVM